jgi:hypothetical protein
VERTNTVQNPTTSTPEPSPKENTRGFQNYTYYSNGSRGSSTTPRYSTKCQHPPIRIQGIETISKHPINQEIAQLESNSLRSIQLQRIRDSIAESLDNNPIEKILPFNFPPWKRDIPFSVEISKLSKEDSTLIHNEYINQQRHKNLVAIYTDASSMPQ